MANQKITQMQRVAPVKPDDIVYIVQDGISSGVKISELFGKLPDSLFSGSIQLDTIETVISNGGDIEDSHAVTALAVDNIDREFFLTQGTITAPLANFMIKVVYLKVQSGGNAIIRGLIPEIDSLVLHENGDAAILMSTPLGWIYLAGSAVVIRV